MNFFRRNFGNKMLDSLKKQSVGLFLSLICVFPSLPIICSGQSNFSGKELREILNDEIRMRVGKDAEIAISKSIPDIVFNEKNVQVIFDFGSETELNGNFVVGIEFRSGKGLLRRIEVPVRVKIFRDVLVAKETIRQGSELTFENCIVERRPIPSNTKFEDLNPDELLGKVARHSIVRGSIISRNLLSEPFAVHRGEKVKIVVLSGKVSVITVGTALQDAGVGEQVRVRREGTQTVISGFAAKDGSVIISN